MSNHWVEFGIFCFFNKEFFNTNNTRNPHILSNFNCIGAPRTYHFPSRTDEISTNFIFFDELGISEKPL